VTVSGEAMPSSKVQGAERKAILLVIHCQEWLLVVIAES